MSVSRREFLAGLSGLGALWVTGAMACRDQAEPEMAAHGPPLESPAPPRELRVFTPAQAKEVEAVAARIIPTDDTPGAREAGVIWFIDGALDSFASDQRDPIVNGLPDLEAAVAKAHPGQTLFSALSDEQQDALLKGMEEGPFFQAMWFATISGMFALPKYGGNADYIGWDLIGQEHVFEHKPPFGWYDRPENQQALLGRVL
jgi:gluconate 2-dehydrogenase gamma chain